MLVYQVRVQFQLVAQNRSILCKKKFHIKRKMIEIACFLVYGSIMYYKMGEIVHKTCFKLVINQNITKNERNQQYTKFQICF